jgi:hypothetical protein
VEDEFDDEQPEIVSEGSQANSVSGNTSVDLSAATAEVLEVKGPKVICIRLTFLESPPDLKK